MTFIPIIDLETFKIKFFLKTHCVEQSLANKSNSQEPLFLYFLQYDPKEVTVLTNLIFFSFRLADRSKIL